MKLLVWTAEGSTNQLRPLSTLDIHALPPIITPSLTHSFFILNTYQALIQLHTNHHREPPSQLIKKANHLHQGINQSWTLNKQEFLHACLQYTNSRSNNLPLDKSIRVFVVPFINQRQAQEKVTELKQTALAHAKAQFEQSNPEPNTTYQDSPDLSLHPKQPPSDPPSLSSPQQLQVPSPLSTATNLVHLNPASPNSNHPQHAIPALPNNNPSKENSDGSVIAPADQNEYTSFTNINTICLSSAHQTDQPSTRQIHHKFYNTTTPSQCHQLSSPQSAYHYQVQKPNPEPVHFQQDDHHRQSSLSINHPQPLDPLSHPRLVQSEPNSNRVPNVVAVNNLHHHTVVMPHVHSSQQQVPISATPSPTHVVPITMTDIQIQASHANHRAHVEQMYFREIQVLNQQFDQFMLQQDRDVHQKRQAVQIRDQELVRHQHRYQRILVELCRRQQFEVETIKKIRARPATHLHMHNLSIPTGASMGYPGSAPGLAKASNLLAPQIAPVFTHQSSSSNQIQLTPTPPESSNEQHHFDNEAANILDHSPPVPTCNPPTPVSTAASDNQGISYTLDVGPHMSHTTSSSIIPSPANDCAFVNLNNDPIVMIGKRKRVLSQLYVAPSAHVLSAEPPPKKMHQMQLIRRPPAGLLPAPELMSQPKGPNHLLASEFQPPTLSNQFPQILPAIDPQSLNLAGSLLDQPGPPPISHSLSEQTPDHILIHDHSVAVVSNPALHLSLSSAHAVAHFLDSSTCQPNTKYLGPAGNDNAIMDADPNSPGGLILLETSTNTKKQEQSYPALGPVEKEETPPADKGPTHKITLLVQEQPIHPPVLSGNDMTPADAAPNSQGRSNLCDETSSANKEQNHSTLPPTDKGQAHSSTPLDQEQQPAMSQLDSLPQQQPPMAVPRPAQELKPMSSSSLKLTISTHSTSFSADLSTHSEPPFRLSLAKLTTPFANFGQPSLALPRQPADWLALSI